MSLSSWDDVECYMALHGITVIGYVGDETRLIVIDEDSKYQLAFKMAVQDGRHDSRRTHNALALYDWCTQLLNWVTTKKNHIHYNHSDIN